MCGYFSVLACLFSHVCVSVCVYVCPMCVCACMLCGCTVCACLCVSVTVCVWLTHASLTPGGNILLRVILVQINASTSVKPVFSGAVDLCCGSVV